MIKKKIMYQPVCDCCGKEFVNYATGYCGWEDEDEAEENAEEVGWLSTGDRLYCPDCCTYDDNTGEKIPKCERYFSGR